MKYLVGFGNYARGDDGIGPRLIEAVCERGLDAGFEAIELAGNGISLLTYFTSETEQIVIIDCARMQLEPGACKVFAPHEAKPQCVKSGLTTHASDVLQLIEYGRVAGCHVPPIKIVAIEPKHMAFNDELSSAVQLRFEEYLEIALAQIAMNQKVASCEQ